MEKETKKIVNDNDYKNNFYQKLLKETQDNYITELRKEQLKSYDFLAKSLAELSILEMEKKIKEFTWMNSEDIHYLLKAISNEITVQLFAKRLALGGIV